MEQKKQAANMPKANTNNTATKFGTPSKAAPKAAAPSKKPQAKK